MVGKQSTKRRRRSHSFFRSEVMYLCRLYLLSESAYACLAELGELGLVQFIETESMYKTTNHRFYGVIKHCEEMELLIKDLKINIIDNSIKMPEIIADFASPTNKEITDIDYDLQHLSTELYDVIKNYDILKINYLELIELKEVISGCDKIFDENNTFILLSDTFKHLKNETKLNELLNKQSNEINIIENKLSYFTGVIPRKKCNNFEKMLWRLCYGNYFLKLTEISGHYEDSYTKEKYIKKNLFIIFFHGDAIKIKIKKILDAFHATQYICPETSENRRNIIYDINMKLQDLEKILSETEDHRLRILKAAAGTLDIWSNKIHKYKSIHHILNIMDMDETKKMYFGEVWLPRDDLLLINKAIQRGSQKINLPSPPLIEKIRYDTIPPTYIRTNRFTKGFQAMINAYGLALYRELNPAPYTIITFPFLFAVMFGDVGHGLLLVIFSYWMIHYEKRFLNKKSDNEIWNIFFGGRYVILLMGLFSIYTGAIYNDIFSQSLNILGSKWRINYNVSTVMSNDILQLNPSTNDYLKVPYEFGIDPVWHLAENKIIMTNSFKMKISIIFGVFQMVFGLLLSAINHKYFHNHLAMILEFLPQLIFLNSLFLYLAILIFIKWIMYSCDNNTKKNESCAPSILNIFIDMMMFKASLPKDKECETIMFENEHKFQLFLVIVAFSCIPILFFGKPIFVYLHKVRAEKERFRKLNTFIEKKRKSLNETNYLYGHDPSIITQIPSDLFDETDHMDEVVIHQGIHTIESVLGSVSHTASYLRLWALSLAHNQLSTVLWDMVFRKGLTATGTFAPIYIYIAFSIWAILTVSILVLMEGLSAFLHALRLHWVEFQSKFYLGNGYLFTPFNFKRGE